jgi:hypothetical protein
MCPEATAMENSALKLSVPTATPKEVERGLQAALAMFERAGINPNDAASGHFEREGWDARDFQGRIAASDLTSAQVWDAAEEAARNAACADWPAHRIKEVHLQIVTDPEAQLADRDTALKMLRRMVDYGVRQRRDGVLARIVVEQVADREQARKLVADTTTAFYRLSTAGWSRMEPVESKRQAVIDAINALEAA